jgi:hypothetical protein
MSAETPELGDPNQTPDPPESSPQFQAMRDQAAKATTYKAEAEGALQRAQVAEQRAALLEIGVQPDSPQGKKLIKLHGGDFTADALRQTATEYGESLPQPAGQVPAEQVAAATRMAQAGVGAAHTDTVSDLQRDLDALPKYGDAGWGPQGFHDVITKYGGRVVAERVRNPQLIDPNTGRAMKFNQEQAYVRPAP